MSRKWPTAEDASRAVFSLPSALRWLGNADGRLHRRVDVSSAGRASIEVRGVDRPEHAALAADAKAAVEQLEGVHWAEVDGILGRIVVVFDPGSIDVDDVIETLGTVEEIHEVHDERFPHGRPDHPADREPILLNLFGIAADLAGLGYATAAQTLHFMRLPSEIPGLVAVADNSPRVRRFLEQRLGPPATDVVMTTTNAAAQALGQGPLGLVVDIGHRSIKLGEQRSRSATWRRRESALVSDRRRLGQRAVVFPRRPVALPDGPIESYTDRAALGSLAAVATVLGVTRDPRRASKLLLTGIPKAAILGREAFAAEFDRSLAEHDVLTMDPAALRRLDRVDTLVIEARTVTSDRWMIADIVGFGPEEDPLELAKRAHALFDVDDPLADHTRRSWRLCPLDRDGLVLPRGAKNRARLLGVGGRKVTGLWRNEALVALVSVQAEPIELADEVVQAAVEEGLEVHLAGGTNAMAQRLGIERRMRSTRLVEEIQDLQREGRVVMFLGSTHLAALRVADVGLAVESDDHSVPWSAHLMVGSGLENAWRIIRSIGTAREVSRRSVLLALSGASTGGLWSLFGPAGAATQRALLPINATALVSLGLGAGSARHAARRRPPRVTMREPWHELASVEALDRLGATADGLDAAERRRRHDGSTSRVVEAPIDLGRAMIEELANPLTPLLGLGAALSAAVGSAVDAALVGGVVGVNALVGAVQRVQTERSLQRLEQAGENQVTVRTHHGSETVPADTLVPGDVIELESGETVPADCRILDSLNLEVDESTITGESLPVAKSAAATPGAAVPDQTSMLFEGSSIAAGTVTALVVAVGVDTETGRSAAAGSAPPPSGVEQRLSRLTNMTLPVSLVGGAAVTGLGLLRGQPIRDAVGTGVSLMVAAVPEGLPALATLSQVAAARRLADKNALVRNPRALEALGRVDQMCFDKTGTLTENSISLVLVSADGEDESMGELTHRGTAVVAAALRATPVANGAGPLPHATDQAILAAAALEGILEHDGLSAWKRLEEVPFESRRGYHVVLGATEPSRRLVSVKGAPEVVLPRCTHRWSNGETVPMSEAALVQLHADVDRLGRRGLRVLAVAQGAGPETTEISVDEPPDGLELIGLVALADPIRPSAKAALRDVRAAGVRIAMITGDHASTAEAIAAELGMLNGGRIVVGSDLAEMDDAELDAIIGDVSVFARVAPSQKVRIVESYQRCGRSVAMTGDGANDAAAIRLADAGIALGGGNGNAAARAVADVVVTDDRIETIVDAIVEGRAMWESVRSAVAILVGGNLGEIGFIVFGTAVSGASPVNARQLLLVNLLTDMAPALAIALREPPDRTPERLLHEGPDASLGGALSREIAVRAGTTAAGATAAWAVASATGTPTRARTVALAALVGTQLAQTLVSGGRSPVVVGASMVSAGALVVAIQTPGVSQFFGCRPLGPVGWATATTAALGATGVSAGLPWVAERVGHRILDHDASAGILRAVDAIDGGADLTGVTNQVGVATETSGASPAVTPASVDVVDAIRRR
jgi:cation-transporting ATPase I